MATTIPTAKQLYLGRDRIQPSQLQPLEEAFFRALRLPNGTFKSTYPRRLDDLNELVMQFLPRDRKLQIMDVAISSGVATFEWCQALRTAGIQYHMLAGDLLIHAYLLSVTPYLNVLVDRTGYALQYDVFGTPIRTPVTPKKWMAFFAPILLLRWAAAKMRPALLQATGNDAANRVSGNKLIGCRHIKLVSPTLERMREIEVVEDDVLKSTGYEGRFDVIRAANLLHRYYFDDETLRTMLRNLRSRLRADGKFIVCRTNDQGINHGTVFRLRADGKFEALARLNDGSDIEELVLTLAA